MHNQTVIVVGDAFTDFAKQENVATYSDTMTMIKEHKFEGLLTVIPGQGIHREKIDDLVRLIATTRNVVLATSAEKLADVAGKELCHKVKQENALVGKPERLSDNVFHLDLLVDDRCEIMSDHITGLHLQGMLVIEAARQSLLAVTETYYCDSDTKYYFVINRMDTHFHKFCFPVGADIRYTIRNLEIKSNGKINGEATVEFFQGDQEPLSVCELSYSALQAEYLSTKEREIAQQTVSNLLANYSEPEEELPLTA
ncbi:AfsA-related hotdog domain-containing protein [Litoribrevibacter albus]|uniref:A-factor biosynthesis hotdog domain-containing protein n=1 Tax=Litoribrevibacter albus TaxID=1473156 RepID=A0AA37S8I6_9GAMM|nr:AfsA-related hotdog domain-containing protein [Litoribrevibacter albus]GLQ30413.1 hypothetical protein GCM10007876_08910 [Litoribrevibacter albus]